MDFLGAWSRTETSMLLKSLNFCNLLCTRGQWIYVFLLLSTMRLHYLDVLVTVILQLQVPQVTEEVANAVLDLYPTLLSLARAYSLIVGGFWLFSVMGSFACNFKYEKDFWILGRPLVLLLIIKMNDGCVA